MVSYPHQAGTAGHNGGTQTVIDTENMSAAQTKAIEAGGTNNHLVAKALVKRGIFEATESGAFKYMPTAEFLNMQEKNFADAMEAEENAQDDGSHEAWQIEQENRADRVMEIEALSDEFMTCDAERAEEIRTRLAELGAEPPALIGCFPPVEDSKQITNPALTAEQAFAAAVRADDMDAAREILGETAPAVRDPRETRYAHIERWTDDNLLIKAGILAQRLGRRTLMKADRMQAERHAAIVKKEIEARGI